MSHFLGVVVPDGRTFNQTTGLDLTPRPGSLGGPRLVILHFDNVNLTAGAKLTVELGYGTDVFNKNSGTDFWSRPVDTSIAPIPIRITGTGSARLLEFGAGEPSITPGTIDTPSTPPGTPCGSQSDPDPFLQTNPYQEPIYETRLKCGGTFEFVNAACSLSSVTDAVKNRVAAAVGIIVEVHDDPRSLIRRFVSSCSGTLIAPDLFLTARHCLNEPSGEDLRSASVTFDYATECDGSRPAGHVTRFFKVIEEVASGGAATGSQPPVATDWVIVRLDAAPGGLPAPLAMRDAVLMNGEVIFTMHHPNGAVKKTQAGIYGGGSSITGFDFGGGSSGSALFDASGQLVMGPLSQGGSCFSAGACSVTYAPIAPIKAALATPPPPPKPLDVMIVFDRSGSMASPAPPIGRTKLQEAQDAASLFVQLVREGAGDQLGMVTFSSTADLPTSLGLVAAKKTELVGLAPFITGDVGGITAGGSTSIGAGVGIALLALAFGGSSANDRAILLLTDGLQNTLPMIEEIEGSLGATKLNVIGLGSDADIDGPLLSRVAREHRGQFTRAVDGLGLRKFFGLSFGNIFEAGALGDPESNLRASQAESDPHKFSVCGEERITIILGWDNPSTPLQAHIRTPSGVLLNEKKIKPVRGRTWVFWKIPLPYQGERDGTWSFTVDRVPTGGEIFSQSDVRYFFLVVCSGGPKLVHLGGPRRVYTGDALDSLVSLHFSNGTTPDAEVKLIIKAPTVALGQLVTSAGLQPPSTLVDAVGSFYATLQSIARRSGGTLPVSTATITVPLFDDGDHYDGAMEPDGIYNNRLTDLTKVEGTYEFRAVATFGEGCTATREAFWSVHVEPAIDPKRSGVNFVDVSDQPDGRHGTLCITPRDPYGNPLGPGRGDRFNVSPIPGVKVTGSVKDRGDGTYCVGVVWDPSVAPVPGVVVQQPDRDPATLTPAGPGQPAKDCAEPAEKLLDCLGLKDPEVKRVRVKSVCVEIDLKDEKDCGDC